MYNWKVLTTKTGRLTYAVCDGEFAVMKPQQLTIDRKEQEPEPLEFKDVATALQYEQKHEFENSLNDFLHDSKLAFEAKQRGEYYKRKFPLTDSTSFKALQRRGK